MKFIVKEFNNTTPSAFLEAFVWEFQRGKLHISFSFFIKVRQHRQRSKTFQSHTAISVNKINLPEAQKNELWHGCNPAESSESGWQKGKQEPSVLWRRSCAVTQPCLMWQPCPRVTASPKDRSLGLQISCCSSALKIKADISASKHLIISIQT